MAYIEKEPIVEFITKGLNNPDKTKAFGHDAIEILTEIEYTPTADVVEVKHGEWFLLDDCANEGVYCSVCHKKVYKKCYENQKLKSKYCPNCAAKMDGRDINVSTK